MIGLHFATALLSLVVGAVLLAREKGTTSHKRLGRLWVALILVVALSSFWILEIRDGAGFSVIHLLSAWTLVSLALAVYFVRRGNVRAHKGFMVGTFIGLAAAGLAAIAIALPAVHAAAAEKEDRAVAATEQLLTDAHAALTGAGGDAALREAIDRAFAFDVWERFLIENREGEFTPEQRERFRALLPGYLAYLYQNQFDRGLDTPPAVGAAKPARNDVLVSATFKRANGADLPVEWRIREFPEQGPQVIDVMVGGTSFLLLKRDEFTAIIDDRGAEGLLDHMEQHSL